MAAIFRNLDKIFQINGAVLNMAAYQTIKPIVDDVRDLRNKTMHFPNRCMISAEFTDWWTDMRSILVQANYKKLQEFDHLKLCLLDPYIEARVQYLEDFCREVQSDYCKIDDLNKVKDDINKKELARNQQMQGFQSQLKHHVSKISDIEGMYFKNITLHLMIIIYMTNIFHF